MKGFTEIIAKWPSLAALADDLGVQYVTAQAMWRRGRISSSYWNALIAGAARRGIEGVTLEVLASISESQRRSGPDNDSGERGATPASAA